MNTGVKVLLGAVGGALVGGGITYFVTKRYYETILNNEIADVKDYYAERYSEKEETDEEVCKATQVEQEDRGSFSIKEEVKEDGKKSFTVSYAGYSSTDSNRSRDSKVEQEEEKVKVLTEEEWEEYDGEADLFKYVYYYTGDNNLVDEENYHKVFRDKDILQWCAKFDWNKIYNEAHEAYDELYLLTAPGVGADDGCLIRVIGVAECGYFETELPYIEDNIWADTGEDCNFGWEESAGIRGEEGTGMWDPEDDGLSDGCF